MKIIKFLSLVMFLVQMACTKPVSDMDKASKWFESNKIELTTINDALIHHPSIQRIDTEIRLDFVPKYANFSDEDLETYADMLKKCKQLGIKNISIFRRGNSRDGQLINIGYTLFSEGVADNGYAISAEFISDESFLVKAKEYGLNYIPQSIDNWYLIEYQN